MQVRQPIQVQPVLRVLQAQMEQMEHRVLKDLQEHKAIKDLKAQLVTQVLRV